MSKRYNISDTWKGFNNVRRLIIFGDSYSSVGRRAQSVKPDTNKPLGVPFPGVSWTEPDKPNWVGHLITKYCPEPRYSPSDAAHYGCPVGDETSHAAWAKSPLLVHDYAKGGDRVSGVKHQIQNLFLPDAEWAAWTATGTLFVTWVGINDCAFIDNEGVQSVVENLLSTQQLLYDAGARNFLLIDLPMIHRSPAVPPHLATVVLEKVLTWNAALRNGAQQFAKENSDSTVLLFSSFETFTTILSKPEEHGFDPDVKRAGGDFWSDRLHPTSKVHDYIARSVAAFLESVQATSKEENAENVQAVVLNLSNRL